MPSISKRDIFHSRCNFQWSKCCLSTKGQASHCSSIMFKLCKEFLKPKVSYLKNEKVARLFLKKYIIDWCEVFLLVSSNSWLMSEFSTSSYFEWRVVHFYNENVFKFSDHLLARHLLWTGSLIWHFFYFIKNFYWSVALNLKHELFWWMFCSFLEVNFYIVFFTSSC